MTHPEIHAAAAQEEKCVITRSDGEVGEKKWLAERRQRGSYVSEEIRSRCCFQKEEIGTKSVFVESDEKKTIRSEKSCTGVSETGEECGLVRFAIVSSFSEPLSFRQFEAKESGRGVIGPVEIRHAAEDEKLVMCAAAWRGGAKGKQTGAKARAWGSVRVVERVCAVVEKRPGHVDAAVVSCNVETPEIAKNGIGSTSSEENAEGITESNEGVRPARSGNCSLRFDRYPLTIMKVKKERIQQGLGGIFSSADHENSLANSTNSGT